MLRSVQLKPSARLWCDTRLCPICAHDICVGHSQCIDATDRGADTKKVVKEQFISEWSKGLSTNVSFRLHVMRGSCAAHAVQRPEDAFGSLSMQVLALCRTAVSMSTTCRTSVFMSVLQVAVNGIKRQYLVNRGCSDSMLEI